MPTLEHAQMPTLKHIQMPTLEHAQMPTLELLHRLKIMAKMVGRGIAEEAEVWSAAKSPLIFYTTITSKLKKNKNRVIPRQINQGCPPHPLRFF